MRLAKYVKLDDVFKIRACYFAVKTDASMIIRIDEESTVGDMTNVRNEVTTLGEFFCGTQTIWLQNIKHTEQMKKYIKITFTISPTTFLRQIGILNIKMLIPQTT